MNGHLVAVEVGVEGGADQRMELDGLAFDKYRFECLDAKPVQGRSTVEHDREFPDHFIQGVPDLRGFAFDHLLGRFYGGNVALFFKFVVDKGFKELEGHFLGQPALVEPEIGADNDNGTPRVVNAFAQQILPEPALFSLEHVAQGLERDACSPRLWFCPGARCRTERQRLPEASVFHCG